MLTIQIWAQQEKSSLIWSIAIKYTSSPLHAPLQPLTHHIVLFSILLGSNVHFYFHSALTRRNCLDLTSMHKMRSVSRSGTYWLHVIGQRKPTNDMRSVATPLYTIQHADPQPLIPVPDEYFIHPLLFCIGTMNLLALLSMHRAMFCYVCECVCVWHLLAYNMLDFEQIVTDSDANAQNLQCSKIPCNQPVSHAHVSISYCLLKCRRCLTIRYD